MVPTVFVLVYEMTQPAVQSLHTAVVLRDPPHGSATVETLTMGDDGLEALRRSI